MAIRNIKKSLAGMNDLLQGVGEETQLRGDESYVIARVDVPYAVTSIVDLQAIDVAKYSSARVYSSIMEYAEYKYDDADLTGVIPSEGPGSWLISSVSRATSAFLADIDSTINTASKYEGKQAWDSTAARPVWSTGDATADVWVYADGTTAQTPV